MTDPNTDQPDPLLRFVDALAGCAEAEVNAPDATDETVREAHLVVLLCEGPSRSARWQRGRGTLPPAAVKG